MISVYLSLIETDKEKSLIEELYDKNKQTMYSIAFSNLHNRTDAEDAVHEAILRAIRLKSSLRSRPTISALI